MLCLVFLWHFRPTLHDISIKIFSTIFFWLFTAKHSWRNNFLIYIPRIIKKNINFDTCELFLYHFFRFHQSRLCLNKTCVTSIKQKKFELKNGNGCVACRLPLIPGIVCILLPNEYQHLHGVEVDALYVDWPWIHVDGRSIRISLSRHLVKPSSGEVNVSRVKKAHHAHRMMRGTHDWCCWCFARWGTRHRLLDVWFVGFHRVLFSWRCCWRRRWAHVWFCLDSAFDARPTDWISTLLKF